RLAGHFDHKVHLVVDGHSAHRSKKVRDWLAAHPDDVELHFLPPYSPELNPDELVNADLKHSLPNLPNRHRPYAVPPATIDYGARRTTEGKTKREIIRCLMRYVIREVYHLLRPAPHTAPAAS
ncbi:transposase, partial [Streptomyces parvus]|uniref:transposase n=1 Tax=Streptomyces parvus TaxID=66428 RepID=UPI0021CC7F97